MPPGRPDMLGELCFPAGLGAPDELEVASERKFAASALATAPTARWINESLLDSCVQNYFSCRNPS